MSTTTAQTFTPVRLAPAQLRERWLQMIDDPLLAAIPYQVELNDKGAIEVNPASNRHAPRGGRERSLARERRERHRIIAKSGRLASSAFGVELVLPPYGAELFPRKRGRLANS